MLASPTPDPRVIDLYKLAVEMADRVSARRAGANSFFVSIQSAVVAALGFMLARELKPPAFLLVALCGVGMAGALIWYLVLRSYRDLNKAKFAVINEIEKELPVQIFTDEWKVLKEDPVPLWRKQYAELGSVERVAPMLFASIDACIAIYILAFA